MSISPITEASEVSAQGHSGAGTFPRKGVWQANGVQGEGRGIFWLRGSSCFVPLPFPYLQAPALGTTLSQEPRLANGTRSCPSVCIAHTWFPWEHLRRRMLHSQLLVALDKQWCWMLLRSSEPSFLLPPASSNALSKHPLNHAKIG